MRFRIFFFLVVVFFIGMNLLLLRSEFIGRGPIAGGVPPERIWQKILTAPDNSQLAILHQGKKLGYCTWAPNIGEEVAAGKSLSDDLPPQGMVKRLTHYTLDVDGSVSLAAEMRLRLNVHLKFNTNQVIEEFVVSLKRRPDSWEFRLQPAERILFYNRDYNGLVQTNAYQLSKSKDLEQLLRDVGLPILPGTLAALGIEPSRSAFSPAWLGLEWTAANDRLHFGQARLRVYRLEVSLLSQYRARIFVSHIGEILKVELPEGIVLNNDELVGMF